MEAMTEVDLKKMFWHSRRGMLELDLLLVPFATDRLASLAPEDQRRYQKLLEEEDQDLFTWLIEKESAPEEDLRKIISIILDRKKQD